jgi:hypothetical protein
VRGERATVEAATVVTVVTVVTIVLLANVVADTRHIAVS